MFWNRESKQAIKHAIPDIQKRQFQLTSEKYKQFKIEKKVLCPENANFVIVIINFYFIVYFVQNFTIIRSHIIETIFFFCII